MAGITPESAAIGQAVRAAVVQAGLTLAETAEATGIALNTLSRRVNGVIPFTWPELVLIAEVTGVSCTELATSAERIAERTTAKASA